MEIAVIGGGHGCYAAAASLSEQGHNVRLWRRDTAAFAPVLETGVIEVLDSHGQRPVTIARPTTDLAAAMHGAALVVLPLPATTQTALAPQIAPYFEDGQVAFLPPGTFGGYLFARAMREAGNNAGVAFAETGTLPYLARRRGPASVAISGYGTRLPTGVFPARQASAALEVIRHAYPAAEPCGDLLSGALMNAGPIIHPPLIMMNAGPLEHFEAWDIHNEGTQPAIRRTTDKLDSERIAVREALGYGAPHFPLADHYSPGGDEWMYGNAAHEKLTDSGDWREHIVLTEHRYMLEDVELGLAFLCSCAEYTGVDAGVAQGLLAIGSAICGRDFRRTGRTLASLGLAELDHAALERLLHEGL